LWSHSLQWVLQGLRLLDLLFVWLDVLVPLVVVAALSCVWPAVLAS
jgi:hypothetical protein